MTICQTSSFCACPDLLFVDNGGESFKQFSPMPDDLNDPHIHLSTVLLAKERQQTIPIEVADGDVAERQWALLNVGQIGFFRVLYDKDMMQSLSKAIEKNQLTTADTLTSKKKKT